MPCVWQNARDGKDDKKAAELGVLLLKLANGIGLLEGDIEAWFKGDNTEGGMSNEEIDSLVQQRLDAKVNKDWGLADIIRDEF